MIALGFGVAALAGALIFWRTGRDDGGKIGVQKVGGEIVALGRPASMPDPRILRRPGR